MEFRRPIEIWKDPRQNIIDFGRIFCIGIFLIGTFFQWRAFGWQLSWDTFTSNPKIAVTCWFIGGVILTLSTFTPWLIRPVYFLWIMIGQCLGWVMNKVVLAVIYYLVFTPVGLLYRRWSGVITKGPNSKLETYWEPKITGRNKKSYYRQF